MHPEITRQIAALHAMDMQTQATAARRARQARRARRGHGALPAAAGRSAPCPDLVLRHA
jgi:hypothetical protein